jgi:hypothetical protein
MHNEWKPWRPDRDRRLITREQWLVSGSPGQMIDHLGKVQRVYRTRCGQRGLLLFDIACCRRGGRLLAQDPVVVALEVAERYAEGIITWRSFERVCRAILAEVEDSLPEIVCIREDHLRRWIKSSGTRQIDSLRHGVLALSNLLGWGAGANYLMTAHGVAGHDFVAELRAQCELLRDIFGDPFRPIRFSPAWRTDTAVLLAQRMYESRDFGAMPILADALQDAGCNDDAILDHCRDPNQVHVRGCWVVDAVLGTK